MNGLSAGKIVFFQIALIIILGFSVYASALSGQFIWDDNSLVRDNVYIRNFPAVVQTFTKDIGPFVHKDYSFYRPLQMLSYWADYSVWKLEVVGYHLTNIILHVAVAIALFWLTGLLFKDALLSFFTSLLYVCFPLHVEAVAFISGRADLLSALFLFLAMIFYIKYLDSDRAESYLLAILSYVFALFSKEQSLILPLLLVLYHYVFKKQFKIKIFAPIIGMSVIYAILRAVIIKFDTFHFWKTTTAVDRIPGFFVALAQYMKLVFFPLDLHMEYGKKLFGFSDYPAILGAGIFAALLFYAFKARIRNKLISFSLGFFLITLLPVCNIFPPLNAYMAEHWMYLPSAGIFLILGNFVSSLCRSARFKMAAIFCLTIMVGYYSFLTQIQNYYWRDPVIFFERTIFYAPESLRLYSQLGKEYSKLGDYRKAVKIFRRAVNIEPKSVYLYDKLGRAYYALGDRENAVACYRKAASLDPGYSVPSIK